MTIALPTDDLTPALRATTTRHWQRLKPLIEGDAWYRNVLADAEKSMQLTKLIACSPAALDMCVRDPQGLPEIDAECALSDAADAGFWHRQAQQLEAADTAELNQKLRLLRNRAWSRIVWRDINRLADTNQTIAELSQLADACIQRALDFHHADLATTFGEPRNDRGRVQQLVVIAMGKLGGEELNLSSDIDLIFAFPEAGSTQGGEREVENARFFTKLGQRLIASLDERNGDGFVFRVDMRLRPWGESGPLVSNFDAIEVYYEKHGRDWERYALIKARVCAGDVDAGNDLLEQLRPFVYRRYLDFAVLESLRDMKAMIRAEVARKGLANNIKLGSGGIREVEFAAQCAQLIRAGQMPVLQCRRLQETLEHLVELELLEPDTATQLRSAYLFLRDTEHAIQAYGDQQTQELPEPGAAEDALALAMGTGDVAEFNTRLAAHRDSVAAHFNRLIEVSPEQRAENGNANKWRPLLDAFEADSFHAELVATGFDGADVASAAIDALLNSQTVRRLPAESRERLMRFLPLLLNQLMEVDEPAETLKRLLPMIEAVLGRSTYLVLLTENAPALSNLVKLAADSPWVARNLSEHPLMLDEMLDARRLYSAPSKEDLRQELQQRLLRVDPDDDESFMDALRYFKLTHVMRVAAAELSGRSPLMVASDHLTWLAEVILDEALVHAWRDNVKSYGYPGGVDPADPLPFIIVGYGKLGGIELSYGSDLDLVFVHNTEANAATVPTTESARSIDNGVFMARLGQRIIHLLNTRTRHGQLYEVDMRLRPSGDSGLLAVSLAAFKEYQDKQAWTWEHQALVRARVVAGGEQLAQRFGEVREETLCRQRDETTLLNDVVSMREKMRGQLAPDKRPDAEVFDLKHSDGAIVDIEFMVQYAVLAGSHQYSSLARYTDNIRILESLGEAGLWRREDTESLSDAYRHFRSESHRLSLKELPPVAIAADHAQHRDVVRNRWQQLMRRE